MYICLCKAVTDHDIESAVIAGADSMDQVQNTLAVGTGCGRCASAAQMVIDQTLAIRHKTTDQSSGIRLSQLDAKTVAALVYAA